MESTIFGGKQFLGRVKISGGQQFFGGQREKIGVGNCYLNIHYGVMEIYILTFYYCYIVPKGFLTQGLNVRGSHLKFSFCPKSEYE